MQASREQVLPAMPSGAPGPHDNDRPAPGLSRVTREREQAAARTIGKTSFRTTH